MDKIMLHDVEGKEGILVLKMLLLYGILLF